MSSLMLPLRKATDSCLAYSRTGNDDDSRAEEEGDFTHQDSAKQKRYALFQGLHPSAH